MSDPDMPNRKARRARRANQNGPAKPEQISQIDATVAIEQRQFLMMQVQAAIQRHAGEKMAAGMLDVQGASIFTQQELAKVQAGLTAINEQVQAQRRWTLTPRPSHLDDHNHRP